ncbi:hypothetical protein D2962_09475 [Biomaibacter acetigenes]|uniref:Uncharacterized protein n=1 Tax=Biomaibacter acetigenes TaxID=2316383 RepID=A0A3G2R5X1_9FIRM|nr:hypothetical protein [Biomaibacter acetigenes]AYO30809.1 hypothetical protein D2962_09475 [Biomaibacter acetigenes]
MTPTPELRTRLRKLLNEVIPQGGSETDTRFLNADLDTLLIEAVNIYSAATAGWTMKAGMLQQELGQIEQYSVGEETYKVVNLTTAINAALKMAETYSRMAASGMGSMILRITPPEVL